MTRLGAGPRTLAFLAGAHALISLCAAPARAAGMDWSTFVGGTGSENANGIAVDSQGDIYMVGTSGSSDFPVTPGVVQGTAPGQTNVVITKLRGDGTGILWSTYLGGSGNDDGKAIAVDAAGNVYVTGNTGSTDFPVTTGAWDRVHGGGIADGFVAKLSADGRTLLYCTFLGGNWDDYPRSIAVDVSGNAYVAGSTNSVDFPVTAGVVKPVRNPSLPDGADGFVTKLDAAGAALVWSTFFGSDGGTDNIFDLALDGSNRPTLVGWTLSPMFPTTNGAFDRTFDNRREGYVTRLNATATGYTYSTFIGGMGHDECLSVAIDASGASYVTGRTEGNGFPLTAGGVQGTFGGGVNDAFALKLSPAGDALVFSTYVGGSGNDHGLGIAVDALGKATLTGSTDSGNFPVTSGAFDNGANGGMDVYVTSLSASGALAYSTYVGFTSADDALSVGVKANGHVVLTGQTASTGFPTTAGAYDRSFAGGPTDGFLASFDPGTGLVGVGPGEEPDASLGSAFPNPSRDAATMRFGVRRATHVRLSIVDLQGRIVRTLVDRELPTGSHQAIWDGRDHEGAAAAPGVYVAVLRLPGVVMTRRIARIP